MKVVLRDPPLLVLIVAIVLDLPVQRVEGVAEKKPAGWASRRLARFVEWRDEVARRAG
jgi:hypothetical protein